MSDDGGLVHGSGSKGREKWSDSGDILKVKQVLQDFPMDWMENL